MSSAGADGGCYGESFPFTARSQCGSSHRWPSYNKTTSLTSASLFLIHLSILFIFSFFIKKKKKKNPFNRNLPLLRATLFSQLSLELLITNGRTNRKGTEAKRLLKKCTINTPLEQIIWPKLWFYLQNYVEKVWKIPPTIFQSQICSVNVLFCQHNITQHQKIQFNTSKHIKFSQFRGCNCYKFGISFDWIMDWKD